MNWFLRDKRGAKLGIGLGLFFTSFLIRFWALNQTPYANGWDGYYYVMQAHSWLEFGYLQSLDFSIIYPYYTLISALLGDYVLSFKFGTAILTGALAVVSYSVLSKSTRNRYLGMLGAVYIVFSPGITFLAAQFPKNLLGITFLIPLIYHLVRKKYAYALLFLILTTLTHRMTAGLGILVILSTFMAQFNWKIITLGLVVVLGLSILPGIINISDFQRFDGVFQVTPHFAPWSFYQLGLIHDNPYWIAEIILFAIIAFLTCYQIVKNIRSAHKAQPLLILGLIILIICFPFFEMQQGSMGYRFFLIYSVSIPFYLIFVDQTVPKKLILGSTGILLVMALFSFKAYNPAYHDAPNEIYYRITRGLEASFDSDEYSLVIAHKSLAEVIIYETSFDALNWSRPEYIEVERVLRIVHGIPRLSMQEYFSQDEYEKIKVVENSYVILPETMWDKLVKGAESKQDTRLLELIYKGNNPLQQRPEYLKRGKTDG